MAYREAGGLIVIRLQSYQIRFADVALNDVHIAPSLNDVAFCAWSFLI